MTWELTPDERVAVDAAVLEFRRVNHGRSLAQGCLDITVPLSTFELVEAAFSKLPYEFPAADPSEPRDHLIFKGVHMFHD